MYRNLQITFDAVDAPRLAEFWALALDYTLQPPPPGFESWDDFADEMNIPKADRSAIGSAVDPTGQGPRLLFLNVPESKTAKNRVHLDVHPAADLEPSEREPIRLAKVAELINAGATHVTDHTEHERTWSVLLDPEGNEFCVT